MSNRSTLSATFICIALLAVGCGSPSGSTDKQSAEPAIPAPEPAQIQMTAPAPAEEAQVADAPAPAVEPAETPVSPPQALAASPVAAPAATPVATTTTKPLAAALTPAKEPTDAAPTPAPSAPAPAPVATTSPPPAAPAATTAIADPGGAVAVAATKPGLARIGAEACGDCHDVQFESWAGGAHGKRNPPLDCEDCHGPGSEYKSKAVMKDPVKAAAAGLVTPDKAFCAKCHKKGVDDAFMEKAHAHEG